uniref:Uncharacterized protein n=1 Tax=Rhizophora mucronata TaxID=61149 RepID=A0A2P2PX33_RHIMU
MANCPSTSPDNLLLDKSNIFVKLILPRE